MTIPMPPDYDAFKAEVVSDQGDDRQGVYEVWWAANSRHPDLSLSARLAIAESVVRDLLANGRFVLVQGPWIGPDHERTVIADPDAALSDGATWVPQPDQGVVWLSDG